ncbi:hypothetical protein ANO11243_014200 [Dothideomycetidae sp. 11243]|nr:hypothetical protein ANO11243_014200 [fungal sp. No.11243]
MPTNTAESLPPSTPGHHATISSSVEHPQRSNTNTPNPIAHGDRANITAARDLDSDRGSFVVNNYHEDADPIRTSHGTTSAPAPVGHIDHGSQYGYQYAIPGDFRTNVAFETFHHQSGRSIPMHWHGPQYGFVPQHHTQYAYMQGSPMDESHANLSGATNMPPFADFEHPQQRQGYGHPHQPFPIASSAQYIPNPAPYGMAGNNSITRNPVIPTARNIQHPNERNSQRKSQHTTAGYNVQRDNRDLPASQMVSYPRGPPKKPKQSGYALWVGNLPPGTAILELKDHFSRGATRDIESVFLISKSNCAFVNYRTAEACKAAMSRFHDSRLRGTRLVCRLRQTQTSNIAESASVPNTSESDSARKATADYQSDELKVPTPFETVDSHSAETDVSSRVLHKYFIVKSLTMQDLVASVQKGVWATQSHNETILNQAYKKAQTVYLIFSANKSGEYFGYARMCSPVPTGEMADETRVTIQPDDSSIGPSSRATPATEFAPKGRVIDDSARGTIFWEVDNPEPRDETGEHGALGQPSLQEESNETDPNARQDWGRPFQIQWLCTESLPFYKTRGLRNPWNANREVKIARDGTELEPSVGKRLLELFHEPGPTTDGV